MWNKPPFALRNATKMEVLQFKTLLDNYLQTTEDYPHLLNEGSPRCNNDLASMIYCQNQDVRKMMGRAPLSTKY